MPKPLDVVLGDELPKPRQDAIDAVRASGCTDDNSMEFWDRVGRVQKICAEYTTTPMAAAKALAIVDPHLSPDGERGHMAVFDSDINRLVRDVANAIEQQAKGGSK